MLARTTYRLLLSSAYLLLSGCTGVSYGRDDDDRQAAAASYARVPIQGAPSSVPAEQQADLNIKLRGLSPAPTSETRALLADGSGMDPLAPQLHTIFPGGQPPAVTQAYRVGRFDGSGTEGGAVHVIELATKGGEALRVPFTGRDVAPGIKAVVVYADADSLTLKYTPEDSIVNGYAVHLLGIEVEPGLLEAYRACVAAGRRELPGLATGQQLGWAQGGTKVAIRDTGSFMDPRLRKDWWQGAGAGAPGPATPPAEPAPTPPATTPPATPPAATPTPPTGGGVRCTSGETQFDAASALTPGATVAVTIRAAGSYTWVMAGIQPAGGEARWFGGAREVSCNGGCRWTFDVKVPTGGGYTLLFMKDAVNDTPGAGSVVGSCKP
ncbi:MAG: hypothetical protein IT371_05125 [Deltaproteobacteria bacterium]|nr:hypothetical protein [Deltaproteobacteria bacterium]